MADDIAFTLPEALSAQKHLRDALGLGEERFPVPAFINMVSDEIEQLRDAGRTDGDIAALVKEASGHAITDVDIARYFTPAEDRHSNER
ncbi:hypothetical protein U1707_03580 [Sphingomonas sp. PB2P12]|uniref:hypothetical protein n=1 Tax=Sphingomonas sandaracina TaxID=3096157 RepID=UPI002FCA615E